MTGENRGIWFVWGSACVVLLLCCFSSSAQTADKSNVLKKCRDLFGPSIDPRQYLFEVNSQFVLRVKFDIRDELIEMYVFPKYSLEESHPEWTEPEKRVFLSRAEYESLLVQLDSIKPKGRLIQSVQNGAITNSTERYMDQYEHGYLNWFEWWDWHASDNFKKEIRFFHFYFFHLVEGKVKKKARFNYGFGTPKPPYYYIAVGDCHFLVRQSDYWSLKSGRVAKVLVAGPLNAGDCPE